MSFVHITVKHSLLPLTSTTHVQMWCVVCCHRQMSEEIYANMSLKGPIFVLFYPKLNLEKLGSPFLFKNCFPLLVSPIPIFFQVSPFLKFSKFGFLPLLKEGDTLWKLVVRQKMICCVTVYHDASFCKYTSSKMIRDENWSNTSLVCP